MKPTTRDTKKSLDSSLRDDSGDDGGMDSCTICPYSSISMVVRPSNVDQGRILWGKSINKIGGRWKSNLSGGSGWLINKDKLNKLEDILQYEGVRVIYEKEEIDRDDGGASDDDKTLKYSSTLGRNISNYDARSKTIPARSMGKRDSSRNNGSRNNGSRSDGSRKNSRYRATDSRASFDSSSDDERIQEVLQRDRRISKQRVIDDNHMNHSDDEDVLTLSRRIRYILAKNTELQNRINILERKF